MRELRERAGQIVKAVCLLLAVVVVCQLAGVVIRWNPFRGVTVPELPVLVAATNSPAEGAPKTNLVAAAAGKGTNGATNRMAPSLLASAPTNAAGTNARLPLASSKTNSVTNSVVSATLAEKGTHSVAQAEAALPGTNKTASLGTTNVVSTDTGTNGATNGMAPSLLTSAPANTASTNAGTMTAADANPPLHESSTNTASTNTATMTATNAATNGMASSLLTSAPANTTMLSTNQGTNLLASAAAGTNAAAAKSKRHPPGGAPMPGMAGKPGANLPPAVQARIQQITDSELLAPVMHPLPMALLGIAGEVAFLRSANGQTGMVKEGDSLDDLKLLRIGINRVLIEQDGQKKELMIFSGYGGDSLLPTNSTNENNHP